jgi:hypothetical protein
MSGDWSTNNLFIAELTSLGALLNGIGANLLFNLKKKTQNHKVGKMRIKSSFALKVQTQTKTRFFLRHHYFRLLTTLTQFLKEKKKKTILTQTPKHLSGGGRPTSTTTGAEASTRLVGCP